MFQSRFNAPIIEFCDRNFNSLSIIEHLLYDKIKVYIETDLHASHKFDIEVYLK